MIFVEKVGLVNIELIYEVINILNQEIVGTETKTLFF